MFCFDEFILCHWQIHANIFLITSFSVVQHESKTIEFIPLWYELESIWQISPISFGIRIYIHIVIGNALSFSSITVATKNIRVETFQFQNNASVNFILFFDSKVAPLKCTQSMQTQALDRQILNALMLIWILFCFFHCFNVSLQLTIKMLQCKLEL